MKKLNILLSILFLINFILVYATNVKIKNLSKICGIEKSGEKSEESMEVFLNSWNRNFSIYVENNTLPIFCDMPPEKYNRIFAKVGVEDVHRKKIKIIYKREKDCLEIIRAEDISPLAPSNGHPCTSDDPSCRS